MWLWIVTPILLVAFFLFERWMFHALQDNPANLFGPIPTGRPQSS